MTMTLTILTAIALSAVPILLLCIGDPKRRRTAEKNSNGMATARRRILTVIASVPGIVCALTGDSAACLMWLGGGDRKSAVEGKSVSGRVGVGGGLSVQKNIY